MEIEDAFTQEALENMSVGGGDEDEIRKIIRNIYESNQIEYHVEEENVAVLCFVAGRAYQASLDGVLEEGIVVTMSPDAASLFIEYLTLRLKEEM